MQLRCFGGQRPPARPLCRLTNRSTGPTAAYRLAREAPSFILRLAGQSPCRAGPVSSNVSRHIAPMLRFALLSKSEGRPRASCQPFGGRCQSGPGRSTAVHGRWSTGMAPYLARHCRNRCRSTPAHARNTAAVLRRPAPHGKAAVPANQSLNWTHRGIPPGPRGALVYPAPRGPGAMPRRSS